MFVGACSSKTPPEEMPMSVMDAKDTNASEAQDINNTQAQALLKELNATKADEQKASKIADEIITSYPRSKEAKYAQEYKDELRQKYKRILDRYMRNLSVRRGESVTWYYNKSSMFELSSMPLFLYITKSKQGSSLMMRIQTTENQSGTILSYSVVTDENEYVIEDASIDQRPIKNGVWVNLDKEMSMQDYAMIKDIAISKNSRVKFSRRGGFYSYALDNKAKKAIINVFNAFLAMKKYEERK